MSKSVTLLRLFNRTGTAVPAKVTAAQSCDLGILPKTRPVACATSEPSHYAVKRVITSTALRTECEDQSRRVDKASYSRPDTRSIATSNHSTNRAGQFRYGSNRWLGVCMAKRSRELQTKCRRKTETGQEAVTPLVQSFKNTKQWKRGFSYETLSRVRCFHEASRSGNSGSALSHQRAR
jgi:hypothetical protein